MRLLTLLIASLLFLGSASLPKKGIWVVESSSRLFIHGNTNVNRFTCSMSCYNYMDTLEYVDDAALCELVFKKNRMSVPISNFDCGNNLITRDFMETLKADQYPWLDIRFLTLSHENSSNQVIGKVEITLAGVSRRYTVKYSLDNNSNENLNLKGSQAVCFSEFNLKAPQKFMGLIQVQDNLQVEFEIHIRPL